MNKMKSAEREGLFPRFKLWLSSKEEEGAFGDGKWRLLKEIERSRSIRAAAEALGMSYRKAWGDMKKAEASLGVKLIEKHRGGADGGESRLTPEGGKWLASYASFRSDMKDAAQKAFDKFIANIEK